MFIPPLIPSKYNSSWAQFSIILPEELNRDKLIDTLKNNGIPSMVYYKIPVHLQRGYSKHGNKIGDFVISEDISKKILSLPMHPYLNESDQDRILSVLENLI